MRGEPDRRRDPPHCRPRRVRPLHRAPAAAPPRRGAVWRRLLCALPDLLRRLVGRAARDAARRGRAAGGRGADARPQRPAARRRLPPPLRLAPLPVRRVRLGLLRRLRGRALPPWLHVRGVGGGEARAALPVLRGGAPRRVRVRRIAAARPHAAAARRRRQARARAARRGRALAAQPAVRAQAARARERAGRRRAGRRARARAAQARRLRRRGQAPDPAGRVAAHGARATSAPAAAPPAAAAAAAAAGWQPRPRGRAHARRCRAGGRCARGRRGGAWRRARAARVRARVPARVWRWPRLANVLRARVHGARRGRVPARARVRAPLPRAARRGGG